MPDRRIKKLEKQLAVERKARLAAEARLQASDGATDSPKPLETSRVPQRVLAKPAGNGQGDAQPDVIATDISEAKAENAALQQSERRYREMLTLLPVGVYVEQDGVLTYANRAAVQTFGARESKQLIGLKMAGLFAADKADTLVRKTAPSAVQAQVTEDAWMLRLDGTLFFAETMAAEIVWDGAPARLVVLEDVTERKNAERLSDVARRAAEDANKAKTDFLASMSHELRTPLNGVLGMANLMLDGALDEEQRERVEVIRQSGGALLSLLNDILDISKVESGQLELEDIDFEIKTILDTAAALWAPQAEAKGIDFVRDETALKYPVLRSDPARIRQILFNLTSNALKFTDEGSITIRISQSPKGAGFVETGIQIIDTGIGIAPDRVDRIFDKFVQADSSITRRYGGSGLGLSLCKSFAAALNGNIGVDSTPGEGSTFWFRIICPIGEAEMVPQAMGLTVGMDDGNKTLRILVAEDNEVNQKVLVSMLGRAGHSVDVANDGSEAISAFMRGPYDLILMDVQMPGMDGITATRRIREVEDGEKKLPIIAVTANAMTGDRESYLKAGMTDYVSKPIEPADLAGALRRQCGEDVAVNFIQALPDPAADEPDSDIDEALFDDLDKLLSEM